MMNAEVRTGRNERLYNARTLETKGGRDSHGRKIERQGNPQAFQKFVSEYPLVKQLIDEAVNARLNFIEQTELGNKIDEPVYLWENPSVNPDGTFEGMHVSVVPRSATKDGDKVYSSVRDLLDMIYFNGGFDEQGNSAGFDVSDVYDYASNLMSNKVFNSVDEKGEPIRRPILEDYIRRKEYNPIAGTTNHNFLQQSQEWQEPTGLANALKLVAPRETGMKLDPEMQTMLDAGNGANEYLAAGGDIGELAASATLKPLRVLGNLMKSRKGLAAAMRIAPSLVSKVVGREPELVKLLRSGVNTAGDKVLNLGVNHPILASAIEGGVGNSAIYAGARGYDELTDRNNYYQSAPFNAENLAVAAGVGAGVPLLSHGATQVLKLGGPFRDIADNLEIATKPRDERLRTALAKSMVKNDPKVGKVLPSEIPDRWVADLGSDLNPTKSWDEWLNSDMVRFEQANPNVRYSMRSLPPSNIERVADKSGTLAKSSAGVGSMKSAVERVENPVTGRLGDESVIYDASGNRTVVSRKESDKFKSATPYSIEDWRSKLTPAQRRRMDEVDPNLSKNFSTANKVTDDPYQIMMQMPGRESATITETPKQYSVNQSKLRDDKRGESVADYRSKSVYVSNESGVPLPLSKQKEFKRIRNDRAKRENASGLYIKGDNKFSTPLSDLENEIAVPLPASIAVRGMNTVARTAGRNVYQGANKNKYIDDKE